MYRLFTKFSKVRENTYRGVFSVFKLVLQSNYNQPQTTIDLAKYLARSNLVTSGLTTFDDQPMNYWAWKASFLTAIAGLDLSAGEELDLLSKYLGKKSAEHVRTLQAVNIRHPSAGLLMAWERLEEIYGSPEAIEQALFDKLEIFPKFTTRKPQRLRELAVLIACIQPDTVERPRKCMQCWMSKATAPWHAPSSLTFSKSQGPLTRTH